MLFYPLFMFSSFSEPEKNFALEYYGPGSKCFNHNKEMWEERTCQQVRQWQHWGSGCYKVSFIPINKFIKKNIDKKNSCIII